MNKMESENITIRKPQRSSSLNNVSDSTTKTFDMSLTSLPNTSVIDNIYVEELKGKIIKLTNELSIAHQEIENLNLENTTLKNEVKQGKRIIEIYKNITPPEGSMTPMSIRKRKKPKTSSASNTPIKKLITEEKFISAETTPLNSPKKQKVKKSKNKSPKTEQVVNNKSNSVNAVKSPLNTNNKIDNSNCDIKPKADSRNKIIILADHQGRNVRNMLQKLIGDKYLVICFWKPGATMSEIINTYNSELSKLTKNDHVVVLGGVNDKDPIKFQMVINNFLQNQNNFNTIIGEVPFNKYLNEQKLNYDIKFACSKNDNAYYLDLNYGQYIYKGNRFTINICKFLLRQILQINYKLNFLTFKNVKRNINIMAKVDKATQTLWSNLNVTERQTQTDDPYFKNTPGTSKSNNTFFRVQ